MILSIITINLNNAKGLLKTMKSVVKQTFTNFEFIIIDGASTDSSIEIIQQFNDSTIQQFSWISEPDTGVFNAMNKGIRMAKGEYLLFLNSGDFLIDEKVLSNVFSFEQTADILCGRCNVSDNGNVIYKTNPPEKFRLSHFYKANIAHQATFIKRKLFDKFELYREDFKLMGDWEFWIRTIILGNVSTKCVDVYVCDYNLEGISNNNNILFFKEMERVYFDLKLQNIVPDYDAWDNERKEMEVMYWVKSKSILYQPLILLYRIAGYLSGLRKK
ncbi:MAG: glycosyltransferase family 2 protein [Bacteroidales bacterium]